MSIYREPGRVYRDVHTFEPVKESPVQAPKTTMSEEHYVSLRKAAPVNTLLPRTLAWAAKLPLELRPTVLLDKYPRIANVLAATWGDANAFNAYMESLLTDKRGNRKGFAADVLRDLGALAFHEHLRNERPET